jgi:hypothetical protein
MLKQVLTATSLAVLLAGSATAATDTRKPTVAPKPSTHTVRPNRHDRGDDNRGDRDRDRDRARDRGGDHDRGHDRGNDRNHDRGHDWRRDDDGHRDRDWRRDDDWRRRGWVHQGGRNDGWRYYRGRDNRHWRYVPPPRYTFDFGYRSGYELAWRDWLAYGRHDRYWRRPGYGVSIGYRSGYDAGWRDAAYYYARGYRPDYWAYDPRGGWFFSFRIEG